MGMSDCTGCPRMKLALPPMPERDLGRSQKNRGPMFWARLREKLCPQSQGPFPWGGRGLEPFVYHISLSLLPGRLMSSGWEGRLQRDRLSTCPDPRPSLKGWTGRQDTMLTECLLHIRALQYLAYIISLDLPSTPRGSILACPFCRESPAEHGPF